MFEFTEVLCPSVHCSRAGRACRVAARRRLLLSISFLLSSLHSLIHLLFPSQSNVPSSLGDTRVAGTSSSFTHQPKDINFSSSPDISLLNGYPIPTPPPPLVMAIRQSLIPKWRLLTTIQPLPHLIRQKIFLKRFHLPKFPILFLPPSPRGIKLVSHPPSFFLTWFGNVSLLMSQLFLVPAFLCLKSTAQRLKTTFRLTKLPLGILHFFRPTCSTTDMTLIARALWKFSLKARETSSPLFTLSLSANI